MIESMTKHEAKMAMDMAACEWAREHMYQSMLIRQWEVARVTGRKKRAEEIDRKINDTCSDEAAAKVAFLEAAEVYRAFEEGE